MEDMILELQDMRSLDWAVRKMSPGTPGCFLKAYDEEVNGKRLYYKLSNYDSYRGVFGHECVNELIVSRLMDVLGIPHVSYRLIHALIMIDGKEQETWISVSDNFRKENEEKLAYDLFYDLQKENDESPLEFAVRNGWELYVYQMFCVDYLVANRDRHGSNLEILRNEKDDSVRIAPLFDQGVSLLFSTYGDEQQIEKVDVMQDFPVNNYIGARSLEYNLSLIPKGFDLEINILKQMDKEYIFCDIDKILSQKHIDKLWEMIWKRWCHFEEVRNKKK
ncbi:MAG: hypothetical protein SPG09_01235 [Lachnospiraceae bacterium]|nr:hypothetical protein [bacterium]MDY5516227.1 hypothetical protein [Lachnospiraceae bacterium]